MMIEEKPEAEGKSFADFLDENPDTEFDSVPTAPHEPLKRGDASEPQFIEQCPGCDGSGEFKKAGRVIGVCYKCKGRGNRRFKTSPEKREGAKTRKYSQRLDEANEALGLERIAAGMNDDQRAATLEAVKLIAKADLKPADVWSVEQLQRREMTPPEIAWLRHLIRKYRRSYGDDLFVRIFPSEVFQ